MRLNRIKKFLSSYRPGTFSLKTVLAVYFVPIAVLPTILLSYYVTQVFEDNTKEGLVRRAQSERDAILSELEAVESDLFSNLKLYATSTRILNAFNSKAKDAFKDAFGAPKPNVLIRVYSPDGKYLWGRTPPGIAPRVAYLGKESLKRVKMRGEVIERFLTNEDRGILTVTRALVRDKRRLYGIIEQELIYGAPQLNDLRSRRQVDVVFLSRDLTSVAASFALAPEIIKSLSSIALRAEEAKVRDPAIITLGDARYAAFVYDFPSTLERNRKWGYVAVFISMTSADATIQKLKTAMIYLATFLILIASLLIFIFSNRLVKPIELLVLAMKRIRTGRIEQIPPLESTYEIEYLVHAFNDMARNVSAAKRTLEMKLEELHRANQEIKNAQTQLVQSAKMVSLGQIVAGVAHELNNPIAFIYSNMHHLSDYVDKIREIVKIYRDLKANLSEKDQLAINTLEKSIDLDFILKDMEDLTKSCVDGANRTKEIVLGLRTFSRMDESSFRPSDLHEGLRTTVRLLVTEFKDRVVIHEEFGELPLVECNLSQMNQVFMNLLSNGAQAISGRGDIWIRTKSLGEMVEIQIEDSGAGIPKDSVEKIFDPFFTTKKVGQGTGLGLSIAYGLVQKHNGSISVTSEVGKGTKFTLRLPKKQNVQLAS